MGDTAGTMRRLTRLVSPAVESLGEIDTWGAQTAAAGVVRRGGAVETHGRAGRSSAGRP
jgi:hypothetical protein